MEVLVRSQLDMLGAIFDGEIFAVSLNFSVQNKAGRNVAELVEFKARGTAGRFIRFLVDMDADFEPLRPTVKVLSVLDPGFVGTVMPLVRYGSAFWKKVELFVLTVQDPPKKLCDEDLLLDLEGLGFGGFVLMDVDDDAHDGQCKL